MPQEHQPGGQSTLAAVTELIPGMTLRAVSTEIVSEPVGISIAYRVALWLKLQNVGGAVFPTQLTIYLQGSPVQGSTDEWYDLAAAGENLAEGINYNGNEVPADPGLSVILPFQNPGGWQQVRVRVVPEMMDSEKYFTGSLLIGSLR